VGVTSVRHQSAMVDEPGDGKAFYCLANVSWNKFPFARGGKASCSVCPGVASRVRGSVCPSGYYSRSQSVATLRVDTVERPGMTSIPVRHRVQRAWGAGFLMYGLPRPGCRTSAGSKDRKWSPLL
jgi:hypothetical protein